MSKALFLQFGVAMALAGPLGLPEQAAIAADTQTQLATLIGSGEVLPFEPIMRRIVSETPATYMGTEFDVPSRIYRFRFVRDGNVFNVDVDARTGQRIRRTKSY